MFHMILCLVFLLFFCFHSLPTSSLPLRNNSTQFCHHDEKLALLRFKKGFAIDPDPVFSFKCTGVQLSYPKTISWKENTDCCFWDGITCDSITGHVSRLDLSCSQLSGSIHPNSSLFHLRHLQSLDLAYNSFFGSHIPPNVGLFSGLKVLNLSNSGFVGEVPVEIARLSRLVLLDLSLPSVMDDIEFYSSLNNFNSTEFMEFFILTMRDALLKLEMPHFNQITKNLTNLSQLHLNRVSINSALPQTLANLSSLTSLQLNFCNLQGAFPSNILKLPYLHTLMVNFNPNLYTDSTHFNNLSSLLEVVDFSNTSLSGMLPEYSLGSQPPQLRKFSVCSCNLSGTIPSWVWKTTEEVLLDMNHFVGELPSAMNTKGLSRVTTISLSYNLLNGTIPSWLLTLPLLKVLNLGGNQFTGNIDESVFLSGNSSIEFLDLSWNNYLSLHLNSFCKLKNLTNLDLSNAALFWKGGVNCTFTWPKLSTLALSSCNISEFPDLLRSQERLEGLDLSNNNIQGDVPTWLQEVGKNSLSLLNLSHNSLTGGLELLSWKNLLYIDLRSNSLQGLLPTPPPQISMFFASNNKFHGEIPASFCNLTLLGFLDLSYNNLSGKIPLCLGNFNGQVLSLRSNRIHGKIPIKFTEYCNLQSMDLNDNQFEGKVPKSLKRCTKLEVLDLGKNRFNDTFPHWLDTLPGLKVLVLQSNNFQGSITHIPQVNKHPFPKLQILDLSGNQFRGELPARYIEKFKAMMVNNGSAHNNGNQYIGSFTNYYHDSVVLTVKGSELTYEKILTIFATLDFSNNRFSGDIPNSVGQLVTLIGLNISHNHLTGHIPSSLANLTSLESLDLSFNRLGGGIPPQLVRLTFLAVFNVSENQLVGKIPQGNQFNAFPSNSYGGNPGLCGEPLPAGCGKRDAPDHQPVSQQEANDFVDVIISLSLWKIIMIGFGFGTILGFIAGGCMLFTVRPAWFSKKVDRIEYTMVQRFKKQSRKRQRRT